MAREIEREISNNQEGNVIGLRRARREKSFDPAGQRTSPGLGVIALRPIQSQHGQTVLLGQTPDPLRDGVPQEGAVRDYEVEG